NPGYTSWVGAWLSPDGETLNTSFVQATGALTPLQRVGARVWDVNMSNVFLRSSNGGDSWSTLRADAFKGVPHAYSGQADAGLSDGTIIRRGNAAELQAAGVRAK